MDVKGVFYFLRRSIEIQNLQHYIYIRGIRYITEGIPFWNEVIGLKIVGMRGLREVGKNKKH
jgi:hypothetical protein